MKTPPFWTLPLTLILSGLLLVGYTHQTSGQDMRRLLSQEPTAMPVASSMVRLLPEQNEWFVSVRCPPGMKISSPSVVEAARENEVLDEQSLRQEQSEMRWRVFLTREESEQIPPRLRIEALCIVDKD